ncbi:MAG: hypothetical protein NVS3B26_30690 [Mycobacteriales bacterium]
MSFTLAGFGIGTGLVLALLARAIRRCHGWARSPAIVLELVALPVGVGLLQGHLWGVGGPVLLVAGATLYHLFAAGPAFASGSEEADVSRLE